MEIDRKKSLIKAALLLPLFCFLSGTAAADDSWDDLRPTRWTEKKTVRGDASHLIPRHTAKDDTVTPAGAEILLTSTPGKVFDWKPLWHNDGLGGCRIIDKGVFSDLSGSWFAERIGEVPGPYSTLFVTGSSYTGEITGGRLLEERLISCAVWNPQNAGWFAAVVPQDKDSRQEILFVPFASDEPLRSIEFTGGEVSSMAALPDGSLWIADSDGRLWHSIDMFRGWALEIIGTFQGKEILLAAAGNGRHVLAAAGKELAVFDKNGKEYSRTDTLPGNIRAIAAASPLSAMLIDDDDKLIMFSGGSVRPLDEYARTAVWMPEAGAYLAALRRKDYLQMIDQEGEPMELRAKSKPGVPEFILPMPGGEALLFTVTGKFSRLTPTKRSIRFAPVFGSGK